MEEMQQGSTRLHGPGPTEIRGLPLENRFRRTRKNSAARGMGVWAQVL